uniref:Uncharacterized protein n=1 Tax=Lactuca sativa TaxID=4236 RepID=A0A9R1VJB6_LACSA|nr:hypothetical protein LSAT_V11C500251320 [Lactuca sativa]
MARNFESTCTESFPMIQEISSPLPESTPMDQDFQIPIIEVVVLPSEGAQASRRSFEAPRVGHYQSSGAADPTSQSSSERVVRPAPDANIDTFLSSGPGLLKKEERSK